MCNCKETDLFCGQAVLAIWERLPRLLNDYWWLIRHDRSELPKLWWGKQGAVNTVACSQMIDVIQVPVGCFEWMGVCKCPGAPSFLPYYQDHISASCSGGCSARLRAVAVCMLKLENADARVLMGCMKPSSWDVLFSCQKKTGNSFSPSVESVRCISIKSVA